MWRTQAGERLLPGAEARLIRTALAVLVGQVEEEIEGFRQSLEFGVPIFDRLQGRQKLVLLVEVAHHLLCSTDPPPPLTATNESAVAVLYRLIKDWVEMEVDNEDDFRELAGEDLFVWRRFLLDAYRESILDDEEVPAETSPDLNDWCLLATRRIWSLSV